MGSTYFESLIYNELLNIKGNIKVFKVWSQASSAIVPAFHCIVKWPASEFKFAMLVKVEEVMHLHYTLQFWSGTQTRRDLMKTDCIASSRAPSQGFREKHRTKIHSYGRIANQVF